MQLAGALFLVLIGALCLPASARAEQQPQNASGEAVFRGNYWRDRNTRVVNPTADVQRETPSGIRVGAHYALDAITSASIAAGAMSDQPFTELRHEAGLRVEVPLVWRRPRLLRAEASYSYSTESDYWSHNVGVRLKSNLFQDNTLLALGFDYGDNSAGKRLGPTGYLHDPSWVLKTYHLVAIATQVLTPRALLTLDYELTYSDGYMGNLYRPVWVATERREIENLPRQRQQHTLALSSHVMLPTGGTLVPHLVLRPGLRYHGTTWGMHAINPELALHVPVGPVELRTLFSYYYQTAASFYRSDPGGRSVYFPGTPGYAADVEWNPDPKAPDYHVYTSDAKLASYNAYTAELQLRWRLSILHRLPGLGGWLSRAALEASFGMWFADGPVGWQFGVPLGGSDPEGPAGCSQVCAAFLASGGLSLPL